MLATGSPFAAMFQNAHERRASAQAMIWTVIKELSIK
jgi:hypothetical protein